MSRSNADADEPHAFPLDPARIPEVDLETLRQYLHQVIEVLPETGVRTLARMLALTVRPPLQGDY